MSAQPAPVATHARQRVSVLGATGSIGSSTLDVIAQHPQRFQVAALCAQDNAEKLATLARQFGASHVAIGNEAHFDTLKTLLAGTGIHVLAGASGVAEVASIPVDLSVCAIVGAAGLVPTMNAIAAAKRVALANKESLVCAGPLVMAACTQHGTPLLPVDSEHNAIFQVLAAEHRAQVEKITLTASGGPFRTRPPETLASVTPAEAVAHPKWNMGAKISVDSATMMNKGLELIEAHYLFALPPAQLDVLVHPQSIVHSLVHYTDGSVLAQLGMPDMRIPIGYALGWPERLPLNTPRLNLAQAGTLQFEAPSDARFPCLGLAKAALAQGARAMVALNAANEVAVAAFLQEQITYPLIAQIVAAVLEKTDNTPISTLADVGDADAHARRHAHLLMQG
ncbi:MAG: 1-deoxy-D-xylulose-5-phosphate reductoisomerase [Azospirillum brasilense]|nr:MAG: 1-deoxy-D-xylulose-5-phosphate reductoisomerase [Azospirillum brasilense]